MSFSDTINRILPPRQGETVRETSKFGPRGSRRHQGVDLSYSNGQAGVISDSPPVYSPVAGTVTRVGPKGGQHEVTIKDASRTLGGKPIYHRFLHNESVLVKEGDSVAAGQKIATVGRRGKGITQYHVHYEVLAGGGYRSGSPMDPVSFWDGDKQKYIPGVPIEELHDTHEEDPEHYVTEAGTAPIPKTPEKATVLYPPKQPTGQIDDYKPRQAATAAYSEAQFAVWTNRVPQHEPWPRTLMVDTEGLNAPTEEHAKNTRHNPQYDENHKDVGRVEGDETTERGPLWRR